MSKTFSKNLYFRPLSIQDISDAYVNWLNNKDINKYLEIRHTRHTKETVIDFLNTTNKSKNEFLNGIFDIQNDKHIGNVKVGNINHVYKTGEISLFIGDKNYWGKRLGKEIIETITGYGFKELELQKIEAGCYESNIASLKSFLACGYETEGLLKGHVVSDGRREGLIRLGIMKNAKIS